MKISVDSLLLRYLPLASLFLLSVESSPAAEATTSQCSWPGSQIGNTERQQQECFITVERSASTCSLYIAESTIPGAGLGIFTGVDRTSNEMVWRGDVFLPLVDVEYHHAYELERNRLLFFPFYDYVWFGAEMGMEQETSHPFVEPEYITALGPGMDAAINCNLALVNVEKVGKPAYDTVGLHRSRDPGAGAFTPYHRLPTVTSAPIPAGGELFKFYGDSWFVSRFEVFGLAPLTGDYEYAEGFLKDFDTFMEQLFETSEPLASEIKWELWDLIVNLAIPSRTINALPKTREMFETARTQGLRAIHQPYATRNLQDLKQKGRCVDQIEARNSTVVQAGRGAFAVRSMDRGSVVASTPVLFLPNSDLFEMYEGDWYEKSDEPNRERIKHYQILYNYCWKHADSSIFLCPYGVGVNYINHGKGGFANVRLQWAPDGEMRHSDELLQQSPMEMTGTANPRLFLDFVASRDIQEGEEIFLDYGDAWQHAWDQHVANFQETNKENRQPDYVSAREWNKLNKGAVLRTEEEQSNEPYPAHFELKCLVNELDVESILSLWRQPSSPAKPCKVIAKVNSANGTQYKVHYKNLRQTNGGQTFESIGTMGWTEVPHLLKREAIRFSDKAYTTDTWLPQSFRHPIGFPDDIFPNAWRGHFFTYDDLTQAFGEEEEDEE